MPYSYVAEGESLRDVLVNFGANYEVSVVVSDKVNDQVNGQFEHDEPLAFLQQLASLYNLVWYYDGNVLYVFKNSEVQSRLINLEQIDPLKVDFRIPENALGAAKVGQPLYVTVDALPGEQFEGSVYAVDPQIDETARNITLRATLPNRSGKLRPGLFARVSLIVSRHENAVLIPERALMPTLRIPKAPRKPVRAERETSTSTREEETLTADTRPPSRARYAVATA